MAFLTSGELTDIRAHLAATFPSTCIISYEVKTADGMGGYTSAWTARGTVDCRFSPSGGFSGITQNRQAEGNAPMLTVAYDQTITLTDKVTINSLDYHVTKINTDESEILVKRVELKRWA